MWIIWKKLTDFSLRTRLRPAGQHLDSGGEVPKDDFIAGTGAEENYSFADLGGKKVSSFAGSPNAVNVKFCGDIPQVIVLSLHRLACRIICSPICECGKVQCVCISVLHII